MAPRSAAATFIAVGVGVGIGLTTAYVLRRRARARRPVLVLFDVDGTLAVPAQKASNELLQVLKTLRERGYLVGIVGAGDYGKQEGQLGGPDLRTRLDFCFSENGVHSFKGTHMLHCKSMREHLGEVLWSEFTAGLDDILSCVRDEAHQLLCAAQPGASIAERGMFLEVRQCTVNVCIIGRTPGLSKAERAAFEAVDRKAGLRRRVLADLICRFGPDTRFRLNFSIGGQIGIDCAPVGWDKTFCLNFLPPNEFPVIHFFGDKTQEGGGDYELYIHPRIIGHTVTCAEHTIEEVKRLFLT